MEPEQRGRASRASSTSSLGREVRCGCQYYQSDSLLPERRALLVRPSSRTMQQPPAVRCRSVIPLYVRVENRNQHVGPPSDPRLRKVVSSGDCPSILIISRYHIALSDRLHRAKPRRVSPQLFKVRPGGYR